MMDILLRNISLIMYTFLLDYFFKGWTEKKKNVLLQNIIICLIIVISFLSDIFLQLEYLTYINIALGVILIAAISKKFTLSNTEILFWLFLLLAMNFICESISVELFQLAFSNQAKEITNQSSMIITTSTTTIVEILFFFTIRTALSRKKTIHDSINALSLLTMCSIPVISIIILFGYLMSEIDLNIDKELIDVFITSGIVVMNICILYIYGNLSTHQARANRISLEKKALESEIKYIEEIRRNQNNLNQVRHDLRNHFLVISGLLEDNNIPSAKKYLIKTLDQKDTKSNFYTTDSVLNYILNEKITEAKLLNIEVSTTIFVSENIKIDFEILAVIIGNLLDNAIEACSRNKKTKSDISVILKQFKSDLLIEINNSYSMDELYTRKERQTAGIGMKSIGSLVDKMGGLYHYWTENDRYFVSIVLFNVYQ
ncbi:sensor histidine kinase [Listeria monocytogenes]|nr:sensor histidine kinase [Listeria monocytogenes]